MSVMDDLTLIQRRVLSFVKTYINNNGYPPSVREIAAGADIKSTSTVHATLNVLEEKGYITRDLKQSRSMVLTGGTSESPVFGVPLVDIGNRKGISFGFIDLPKSLCAEREGVFAFKSPTTLHEAGILRGDIVVVKSQKQCLVGETVILADYTPVISKGDEEIIGRVIVNIRCY